LDVHRHWYVFRDYCFSNDEIRDWLGSEFAVALNRHLRSSRALGFNKVNLLQLPGCWKELVQPR
jgi:hypothetical protein